MTTFVRQRSNCRAPFWSRRATILSFFSRGYVWLCVACLVGVVVWLGCASPLQRIETAQLGSLSEGQIAALDKGGQAVLGCVVVGGPPALGAGVLVVVPKSSQGSVKFTSDCHPAVDITLPGGVAP